MKTINNLLLLTDFSELADNATKYALILAKALKCNIEILHIINTPVDWVKVPLENEHLYPEIKSEISNAKNDLLAIVKKFSNQGINATQALVFNLGVENITQYIDETKYDLIIMGSHGTKGIKEFTLGSNAQKVIRNSNVPVLIVKNPPKNETFEHVVMASTFQEEQKPFFHKFLNFATDLGSEIDLLYINTPYYFKETEEIEKMLTLFCEDCTKKNCGKYHIDAFNEERGVQYFMNTSKADLFAIATQRRSGFSQLFSSSITEAIVHHLNTPVLVFHM